MKTVIYCNVTTGEVFDADGSPRSLNNPFTAAYGERRIFEWHLVTAVSGSSPANWTPLTEFEYTPSIASLAADDTYISAYPGRFVSCENSVVQLELDVDDSLIPGKGQLRLTKTDGSLQEVSYTAVTPCDGGYKFHVDETLAPSDYLAGGTADLLKQPMAKTSFCLPGSVPARGVFQFSLAFRSEKLKKLFEYADVERIATRGLELRLAGLDASSQRVELVRAVVPLTILGVLDQSSLAETIPETELNTYQTWTLAQLSAGIETSFSADGSVWSASSANAEWVRLRPANVANAAWSAPVPLPRPKNVEYSFTIAEGNTAAEQEIPYAALNVSKPFDFSLFQRQSDDSELNITNSSGLQIFCTASAVRLVWSSAIPAGTYVLRG